MHPPDPGLVRDLERLLGPDRVLSRPIDRLSRSADASLYRLVPQAVVRPRGLGEVRDLFALLRRRRGHLTFRAAGTSLSGQTVTDGILVEIAPFWRASRVLGDGQRVWTQPGVVGGHLNRLLAPHRTRIGPDPASIDAAMIGGILANNSSGMCCGVAQNSYQTLDALGILLADGTHVDSSWEDADEQLRRARPDLHAELLALRDDVRADDALAARIRHKFSTKNTSAYSLNALVDYDRPVDILAHLMVGSEGTLGFVAEMTMRTVPEPPARATALVYFAELEEAGTAVPLLAAAGADALEILDSASLRSIAGQHEMAFEVERRHAALLVEFRRDDETALAAVVEQAKAVLGRFRLIETPRFTSGADERARLWQLRKGLAATTGAMRPTGTAFVTEDVAVPVARLAEAILDFQAMFERHGVSDAIIFGHAKDGNLHFVMGEDVRSPEAVERYAAFVQGIVDIVVHKYDGAIKAEHGSGRNMAPFVKTEWGERAYEVMQRIKTLLDPDGLLNPGVLLNDDPHLHLKNLKPCPTISPLADRCTECGFCEPRCPSRDLTLTPAAEDRGHPRDHAAARVGPARGSKMGGVARGRLHLRRRDDVRHRFDVRGRLPGQDRHRGAHQGAEGRALAGVGAPGGGLQGRALRRHRGRRPGRAPGGDDRAEDPGGTGAHRARGGPRARDRAPARVGPRHLSSLPASGPAVAAAG